MHLDGFLADKPNRDAIIRAIAEADPVGPAPAIIPPPIRHVRRRHATGDIRRLGLAGLARKVPGRGSCIRRGRWQDRVALDLGRRAWHGEEWPDGQPMTLPRKSPTIWVASDGQQGELAQSLSAMRMPPEAIIFPTSPDDPFGGTSLDEPETLQALDEAARIHSPAFIVIDSLTYATRLNICDRRRSPS